MLKARYRVKDLVNSLEHSAKDYVDRSGLRRRLSYKPASKSSLNIAESTFWKMVHRGDFPQPTYLTSSIPTWTKRQINIWLRIRSNKLEANLK